MTKSLSLSAGRVTLSGVRGARYVSRFPFPVSRAFALVAVIAALTALPAPAQTPQQLELLRQNPDLVRQRIQQSGMSADQVRAQLRAAGYSPSLLDSFLGDAAPGAAGDVTQTTLRALEALGVTIVTPEGIVPVPIQTGVVAMSVWRRLGQGVSNCSGLTFSNVRRCSSRC